MTIGSLRPVTELEAAAAATRQLWSGKGVAGEEEDVDEDEDEAEDAYLYEAEDAFLYEIDEGNEDPEDEALSVLECISPAALEHLKALLRLEAEAAATEMAAESSATPAAEVPTVGAEAAVGVAPLSPVVSFAAASSDGDDDAASSRVRQSTVGSLSEQQSSPKGAKGAKGSQAAQEAQGAQGAQGVKAAPAPASAAQQQQRRLVQQEDAATTIQLAWKKRQLGHDSAKCVLRLAVHGLSLPCI